jgi:pimeloyl-ACP methyl ester carboxylesterase
MDQGKGKPLIFIHGLGGDHHMFDPQIETFSKTYRVILPHIRGNGLSEGLQGPPEHVLDQQCEDLAELFCYLNIKRAVLCGTSYGGVLCFRFVLRYPEFVQGLVISDSFSDTRIVGFAEGLTFLGNYLSIWTSYLPGEWMIPLLKWRYRKWPVAQKCAVYIAKISRKRDLALQRQAVQRIDYTEQLRSVRCPALGIVGDTSSVSIRAMKRGIYAIPDAKFKVVKNSFDPTNLCQSQVYNTLLENFLNEIKW